MSLRNMGAIVVAVIASMWCYAKADQQGYASVIADAMKNVRRYYVEEVDSRTLFENAMKGMVEGSLDQYSGYIAPKSFRQVEQDLDQEFGGVGIEIEKKQDLPLLVLSPLVNSPAYRGGMRAGDRILKIDGVETAPMSSEDAVSKMRGRPGSPVVLTVTHRGDSDPFDLSVVREIITVQSVLGDRRLSDGSWDYHLGVDNRIGYLRITTFGKHTVEELNRVLAEGSNFEALVLDLRNNAGGLLNAAVETCDLFIDRGQIVSTRGRDSVFGKNYTATSAIAVPYSKPIAVVINGYSASASEIVAACLQDYKRAAIVGQRTWGKGTVQNILPMEGGQSALRLTTATYWRPSGENIHRAKDVADDAAWGVSPDLEFEVVLDDEEAEQLFDQRRQRDLVEGVRRSSAESEVDVSAEEVADRQLDCAIDYLRKRLERND